MSRTGHPLDSVFALAGFVRGEVRAYPGRVNVMLRCLLTSAFVIVTSMALQVPLLAISLIVVFYVTQANVVMTRLVGMLFIVGSTLAIGTTLLLLKLTYDYPLLRITSAGLLFFACVYLMRVTKIGVVFFVVGLVVIYGQTFVDQVDQPELVVRSLLWVWVAVNYAIALTLVVNTLFLPAEPAPQLDAAMLAQLDVVDGVLADLEGGTHTTRRPNARDVQTGTLTLQKLLRFVAMRDPRHREHQAANLARVAAVSRLYAAASQLPATTTEIASGTVAALRNACHTFAGTIRTGKSFTLEASRDWSSGDMPPDVLPGALREMRRTLQAFADRASTPEPTESAAEKQRLLIPDAFTNPVYTQFALKTLLAAMIGYVFYLATDWQGIHTIMLTCLIVAQPSLGATRQRALLRIGGAAIGSLLALAMVVWVVPRIDGIVGLLMMVLPVIALGAWITAGSERISYAGVQIMFTFSLALLEQFGPTTNLTEIRDRMLGIVLGVVLSTFIHATLWPEGEGEALRQRVGGLLHRLAAGLRPEEGAIGKAGEVGETEKAVEQTIPKLWAELGDGEAIAARVALEPGWQMGEGQQEVFTMRMQTLLAQIREILATAIAFEAECDALPMSARATAAAAALRHTLAASLDLYANALTTHPQSVQAPPMPRLDDLAASCAVDMAQRDTDAARDAYGRVLHLARLLADHVSGLPGAEEQAAGITFTLGTSRT